MVRFVRRSLCVSVVSAFAAAPAWAQTSTFDTGTDGWLVVDFPYVHETNLPTHAATWDAGFGLPAGSLHVFDEFPDTGVAAPAIYLGDRSDLYGQALKFDVYIRATDNVAYPEVALRSGDFTLMYVSPSPALDQWHHRSILLTEAGWRFNAWDGPAATEAQMRAALADLRGLYITTEWRTGGDDTSIDNISVPGGRCAADLTGSSDPNDPSYGVPNGILDASDFFYYLDAFAAGNLPVADLTTSSDPNDPTYGIPDGSLDGSDFFYYLDIFAANCP